MVLNIVYKDTRDEDSIERIEDVISISYNYNQVGDIHILYGKYHTKDKTIFTKDIERFSVI